MNKKKKKQEKNEKLAFFLIEKRISLVVLIKQEDKMKVKKKY